MFYTILNTLNYAYTFCYSMFRIYKIKYRVIDTSYLLVTFPQKRVPRRYTRGLVKNIHENTDFVILTRRGICKTHFRISLHYREFVSHENDLISIYALYFSPISTSLPLCEGKNTHAVYVKNNNKQ